MIMLAVNIEFTALFYPQNTLAAMMLATKLTQSAVREQSGA